MNDDEREREREKIIYLYIFSQNIFFKNFCQHLNTKTNTTNPNSQLNKQHHKQASEASLPPLPIGKGAGGMGIYNQASLLK